MLQASNSDGTWLVEVVKLAREVQLQSGITVDFEATPEARLVPQFQSSQLGIQRQRWFHCLNTATLFCPPKPKPLTRALRIGTLRGFQGT